MFNLFRSIVYVFVLAAVVSLTFNLLTFTVVKPVSQGIVAPAADGETASRTNSHDQQIIWLHFALAAALLVLVGLLPASARTVEVGLMAAVPFVLAGSSPLSLISSSLQSSIPSPMLLVTYALITAGVLWVGLRKFKNTEG